LKFYTEKFDKVSLEDLKVSESEIIEAEQSVSDELKSAIKIASENIRKFHNSQQEEKNHRNNRRCFCWRENEQLKILGFIFQEELRLCFPLF
jgi:histidinol dehydrogenase